jgi:predicted Na+-dependent transporter
MSMVDILKIVAPISVALIVFAQALGIDPKLVVAYFMERPGTMLRSLAAALVVVPAAALGLILLLEPAPGLAIGLAVLVACPPAPLMFSSAPKKGGASAAFMASLHLSLAALAFVTVPAAVSLLAMALGFQADIDLGSMAWTLGTTILVPAGLGLLVRALFAETADRLAPALGKAGNIGVLVALVIMLAALYPVLLNTAPWSYLVIATVSVTALAIGHVLGPRDPAEKTALAVECGVRHPALALSIGAMNFGSDRALRVLLPCVLTFIAVAMIYMSWRGRALVNAGEPTPTKG